jgi:hypothetical protein
MFRHAYLEERGAGRLSPEIHDVRSELLRRGVPCELFTAKRVLRRQLPLARDVFVAGYIPTLLQVLKQLGIEPPEPNDYPPCLRPYLRRRVWESTVAAVQARLEDEREPVFVKPRGRVKRFTGAVFDSYHDVWQFQGVSRRQPVYCSEVVTWRSEHRVYVVRGRIVGVRCYQGDAGVEPDLAVIEEAIALLEASGAAWAGYGIDFGVLAGGATALVELNDGFGLGSYDLEPAAYTELLLARWEELMQAASEEQIV